MKRILLGLSFLVVQHFAFAVDMGNVVFSAYRQGSQSGAGNCASIAIIKASIACFGIDSVFKRVVHENGWKVILRTGESLDLSHVELEHARLGFGIVEKDFNGFSVDNWELKREIADYSTFCFAVMVKMVMRYGDGHRSKNNALDSSTYSSFINAMQDLNDGGYTATIYHLLGLEEHVYFPGRFASTANEYCVIWSIGHAMYAYNRFADSYGKRSPMWKYIHRTGRFYIRKEEQINRGKFIKFSST